MIVRMKVKRITVSDDETKPMSVEMSVDGEGTTGVLELYGAQGDLRVFEVGVSMDIDICMAGRR